jgi:hypothetical protein
MAENYVTKTGAYPKSPKAVLCILNACIPPTGWNRRVSRQDVGREEGAMFAQLDNDSWEKNTKCHNRGEKGHLAQECCAKSGEKGDGAKNKD